MKLDFHVTTISNKLDIATFYAFLEKCNGKFIKAIKFDYKETCKKIFEPADPGELYNMFGHYRNFILKGKNGFWLSVQDNFRQGITTWSGGITIGNTQNAQAVITEVIGLLNSLSANGQFLFGYLATEEEYKMKHEVITYFETGGRSIGWEGASTQAFLQQFPGIYSGTFFGSAMYSHIGKEKFLNIPNVNYIDMADGTIGFTLPLPIIECTQDKLQSQREIASHIGEEYFFDKEHSVATTGYPASLMEFLQSLKKK